MSFRNIGGTLAGGLLGAVLTAALLRDRSVTLEVIAKLLSPERSSLPPGLLTQLAGPLESGLGQIFWITAGLAGLAAVVGWMFPHVPTRAAAPADAAAASAH
jgi:hypothetical protein